MNNANPAVEWYFSKPSQWQEEYRLLRSLALDSGLTEELKWGHPCYTLNKKNVVLIHGFKDYCALLFYKGALMNDADGLLVQQTANVQAARQMRFTSVKEIEGSAPIVSLYIHEAIEIEKAGLQVDMKDTSAFAMPDEFARALKEMPAVKKAFRDLSPGRQRGYLLHFSSAKQAKTREARVGKHIDRILAGKGLED